MAAEYTVPIALVARLARLVQRWRIHPRDVLSSAGLTEAALEDPFARLSVERLCVLLERARALTREPGLGYYLGLQTQATLYGYLGFAALSASTVGEALELVLHFAPLFSTALALSMRVEGGIASLIFEERADFGSVRDIALISMISGFRQLGRANTGRDTGGSADYTFPEPAYHSRFASVALYSRFNQPTNRLQFDAAVLSFPVLTADPVALRLMKDQCERELDALRVSTGLASRVRSLIADEDDDIPTVAQIAERLRLSERTLRRRLAAEEVSFSALVDEGRRDKALRMLRSSSPSIEDVGRRLGYATVSSFVRAFHRWTGETPLHYRRRHHGA